MQSQVTSESGDTAGTMVNVPNGLDGAFIPTDNALTQEKIALGKQFFWDKRWSPTGTFACVSCHLPDHGWSDPQPLSTAAGMPTQRHSPPVVNRLFSVAQTWTGKRASLEDQAAGDSAMDGIAHLRAVPEYQQKFKQIFGRDIDAEGIGKVIACYERMLLSGNSPYDRFRTGETLALSADAQQGLVLFGGKAGCANCHSGPNFTDEAYHNLGVGQHQASPDPGRFNVTMNAADQGAFKTPTLRDVAARGPYMHDGSLKTLADVVAFYNAGGIPNASLSPLIKPLNLTSQEQSALVAFLMTLTGEIDPMLGQPPALPQ
jgi:cytochrome c peroxidase